MSQPGEAIREILERARDIGWLFGGEALTHLDALLAALAAAERLAELNSKTAEHFSEVLRSSQAEADALRDAAEDAIAAVLPLLPLNGSHDRGYRVSERIETVLAATPEEWVTAAQAVADLHALLVGSTDEPGGETSA